MKTFKTHVCIISDQPIPNYVPILDTQFRPKEVFLLTTLSNTARNHQYR